MEMKGKNLCQSLIDNPPIKAHGVLRIADGVFIGSSNSAYDQNFLTKNYVTHIINATGTNLIPNIFDFPNKNYE